MKNRTCNHWRVVTTHQQRHEIMVFRCPLHLVFSYSFAHTTVTDPSQHGISQVGLFEIGVRSLKQSMS